ncbi:hypothetical protein Tco_0950055 [Tanacetum coccineum]
MLPEQTRHLLTLELLLFYLTDFIVNWCESYNNDICSAEQDPFVEVVKVPKFDMPFYESKLSKIDVKALAKKGNGSFFYPPVGSHKTLLYTYFSTCAVRFKGIGKGAGGKIFRKTFSRMKGWKNKSLFLDWRAIPDAMAWRHHDSDINDVLPDGDYNVSDARTLVENIIDLHPMPPGLLFVAGLATTWDFPGFQPIFKDTRGNGKEKKKIKATKAVAKKKENTKRVNDREGGSKPKPKKRKTLAAKKPRFTGSDHVFVPIPLRAITPTKPEALIHSGSNNCDDGT